jgi:hypothetical protein
MTPIFLLLIMIFKRELKLEFFAISLLFSFIIPTYDLFDNYIHPFLFNLHIYDFLLKNGQTILNPQYTKILFYLILMSILLIMNIFKKFRTIDRVFVLLIAIVVLITTFIFHITIPMGIFKYERYQLQENLTIQIHQLSEKDLCKDKSCFLLNSDLSIKNKSKDANTELLKKYEYFIVGIKKYYEANGKEEIFTSALGTFNKQRFDYIISAAKLTEDGYFIVMDENVAKSYSRQSEIWFSFLTSTAHFIWVFGGFGLLFLHKIKFFKKKKELIKKEI